MKSKIILILSSLLFLGVNIENSFSQNFSIGMSTDIGYEFYSKFERKNENIFNTYNPTLSSGIIAEISKNYGMLFSIGFKLNKSQRKYTFTRSTFLQSANLNNLTYIKSNKIIDASNLIFSLGYRSKKIKFIIGAQLSKTLKVRSNGSNTIIIDFSGGTSSQNDNIYIRKEKSTIDLVLELKFIILKNLDLSLRYAYDSRSSSYSSNNPRGRITIGVHNFIYQK